MNTKSVSASLPTKYGNFNIVVWNAEKGNETVILMTKQLDVTKTVLVRVHSECMTGDTFGSLRCDCGPQKMKSLQMIEESGNGVFIYLRQEGRGIGLFEKIRAYQLQEQGYDTHQANILLGHNPDQREYSDVKKILNELGIQQLKIITNNPSKISELRGFGFEIIERIPLRVRSNEYNKKYLEVKKVKFKHFYKGNGYNSVYYLGISQIKDIEEIKTIASIVRDKIKDPLVKIGIGISADNSVLLDEKKQSNLKKLFIETERLSHHLIPTLHYSFKNSKDYRSDIKNLAKTFPYVKKILLNDLKSEHLEILQYASKYFSVHFPINENISHLLVNPDFVKIVRNKEVVIIFDNSEGNGRSESFSFYKEKIEICLNNGVNNIGIAGGFGPDKLQQYFQLKDYFKINLSIDAETNLQTGGKLDLKKVEQYLKQLLKLI